jgi:hypothetical protein
MGRRPIEAGENAGKGTGEIRHTVSDNRQMRIGKTRRVTIGVDDELCALSREAGEHALKDSNAADRDASLVAAAHAACQAAGED